MPLKVLVVGSGGREHALIKQLGASRQAAELFAAPGNPGTAILAKNVAVNPADSNRIVSLCQEENMDLVLIGPEDPLIAGLADRLREAGIAVFGPGADGAKIEGDKEFAKEVLAAAKVPTASYATFSERLAAGQYLDTVSYPVVVKAIGAAQGKGVAVCSDRAMAEAHLDRCLTQRKFGAAGARVLIEECLKGPELSVLAITDGVDCALLAPSRDHKRIGEGDTGPNTGGMGAFAPVRLPGDLERRIENDIIQPTLAELRKRGIVYRGVLYAGLMLTAEGPKVLEFNCRFGDPEAQVVLPLITDDFLGLIAAAAHGTLGEYLRGANQLNKNYSISWPGSFITDWNRHSVVVVGAMDGYPDSYVKGVAMTVPEDQEDRAWIIHAGTQLTDQGLVTAGGRIIGAVGCGDSLNTARERAYALLAQVHWAGLYYRRDIAVAAGSAEG